MPESFKKSCKRAAATASGGASRRCPTSAASSPRARSSGPSPSRSSAPTRRCTCTWPARRSPASSTATATTQQADGPADDRPRLGRDHGADRARRRLRRRRRPHEGDRAARRLVAHRGRQAVHHLGRARHDREHHPPRAGPPRRAPAPAPRACRCSSCPKFHFDVETGELGERNGVYVTNVEHKMGLKASTTCELRFGEEHPAVGWLVGDVARRHRADVPGHRARPDDGRHQGDCHAVDRLPERARRSPRPASSPPTSPSAPTRPRRG